VPGGNVLRFVWGVGRTVKEPARTEGCEREAQTSPSRAEKNRQQAGTSNGKGGLRCSAFDDINNLARDRAVSGDGWALPIRFQQQG
jgi:hypothetical protein